MSGKILLILLVALVAYGLGFLVAMEFNGASSAAHHGEAAGRQVTGKAPRAPAPPPPNGPAPRFQYVPPQVKAGQPATIVVQAAPGQVCTIWFVNPAQPQQNLPAPIYAVTGADGLCGWKWIISPTARAAIGTVWVWAGGAPIQQSFSIVP